MPERFMDPGRNTAHTGCFFPLNAFEAAVEGDPEIVAMLCTGSLGRGTSDAYSDLDIEVWVTEQAFARTDAKLREVLSMLGSVQFVYSRGPGFVTAFVDPDWQRVDLHLHGLADTKSFAEYTHGRIVKDTVGMLASIVAGAPEEPITTSWEQAQAAIEEAIDSQIYLALHNARGEGWSAAVEITSHLEGLYTLLARARGRASHGFRYVVEVLTPEEQVPLVRAWPANAERDEVRRTASALWVWTRHVWSDLERVLGRPLEIDLDEHGMLDAIDRLYEASQH